MSDCKHDYDNPIRKGRADYRCRLCGENITMDLVFIMQAEEDEEICKHD